MTDTLLSQLATIFADVTGSDPPDPEVDLLEDGVLDSLALVGLLFAIEQQLGVVVPAEKLEVERFRTLARLGELVNDCRGLGTCGAP
jgi:D-alanine--poly(phosphoribitol) ligase subunit 2